MYKIIQNNLVIDVVKIPCFVRFLPHGHIAITDKLSAQGIVGSDDTTIYSFSANKDFSTVSIEEISDTEFNRLNSLLNSGISISADETALAKAKQDKIKHLSNICNNNITTGFSVKLSDGNLYSFKLTTEDQLNLMNLENQLILGAETFIYHATDQPCRFFSKEDMNKIIRAFKNYTLYHTTYFNIAKQYIKALTDIEKVQLFTYGTDVSESTENIVIKQILKNGGNV